MIKLNIFFLNLSITLITLQTNMPPKATSKKRVICDACQSNPQFLSDFKRNHIKSKKHKGNEELRLEKFTKSGNIAEYIENSYTEVINDIPINIPDTSGKQEQEESPHVQYYNIVNIDGKNKYECNIIGCKTRTKYATENRFITHFNDVHSVDNIVKVTYNCPYLTCNMTYKDLHALNKHVNDENNHYDKRLKSDADKTSDILSNLEPPKTTRVGDIKGIRLKRASEYECCNFVDEHKIKCVNAATYRKKNEPFTKCFDHREDNMFLKRRKFCKDYDCIDTPTHNYKNVKPALWCARHADPKMFPVQHSYCTNDDCHTMATYGERSDGIKISCKIHKKYLKDPIVIGGKKCAVHGCGKRPIYGRPGESPTHCSYDKLEGMVDLIHDMCKSGCGVRATYNFKGMKPGYCINHKSMEMIDVNCIVCKYDGCNIRARYGPPGGRIEKCAYHAGTDMINMDRNRCSTDGCNNLAYYNLIGRKPIKCYDCKDDYMVRQPTKLCTFGARCRARAIHGTFKPIYCDRHYDPDFDKLLIGSDICYLCGCVEIVINNICDRCHADPNRATKIIHHKELQVKKFLESKNLSFIHDRILASGCGKERIDIVISANNGNIIAVEVDENQHKHIPTECEKIRMINIKNSIGSNIIFIRFNPDKYDTPKARLTGMQSRYNKLYDEIMKFMHNDPDAIVPLRALYLYYDEYVSDTDRYEIIDNDPYNIM
jgi:hypothetical protein